MSVSAFPFVSVGVSERGNILWRHSSRRSEAIASANEGVLFCGYQGSRTTLLFHERLGMNHSHTTL